MNLLIIGNGFDIAHKLPTKYKDFLHICTLAEKAQVSWREDTPFIFPESLTNREQEEVKLICSKMGRNVWTEFVELIKNNFWIKQFQSRKDIIGENWINLEEEIHYVLEAVHRNMLNSMNEIVSIATWSRELTLLSKFSGLPKVPYTYRELFLKLMEEHKKVVRALELYMDGYINKLSIKPISYIGSRHITRLLSFNYTDTYTEHYNATVETCYLHGKADIRKTANKCNMILGFDDHFHDEAKVIAELVPFEKYCQRIVNRTDSRYLEWINEMEDCEDVNILIYGHSLGTSDGDVLRVFLLHENAKVTIFYYDEIDRAEKIKNLAIILGPNNLIKLTGGNNPRIQFDTDSGH